MNSSPSTDRRRFLKSSLVATGVLAASAVTSQAEAPPEIVRPKSTRRILLSTKLSMVARESGGKKLTINERLTMVTEAGFDGVDFDEAGAFTPEQVRTAVKETGVFVHNAINHAHWGTRLTDPNQEARDKARENMDHCLRVAHAAGGSGILIVVGKGSDGPAEEIEERCRVEIKKSIPLAPRWGSGFFSRMSGIK